MMRTTSEQHPAFRVDNLSHNTQADLLLPESREINLLGRATINIEDFKLRMQK